MVDWEEYKKAWGESPFVGVFATIAVVPYMLAYLPARTVRKVVKPLTDFFIFGWQNAEQAEPPFRLRALRTVDWGVRLLTPFALIGWLCFCCWTATWTPVYMIGQAVKNGLGYEDPWS